MGFYGIQLSALDSCKADVMSMEKIVFQSIFLPKLWISNNPNKKIVKITSEDNQAYIIHHTS